MDLVVGSKFRLKRKIGAGSFGEIYAAEALSDGAEVAVKLEVIRSNSGQLQIESRIYKMLSGGVGIPSIKWFGVEGDYNVLVMELLGKSVEDLFVLCNRKLSVKTVAMLAEQMISRVEYFHNKGLIHRDMKPDNFTIGAGNKSNEIFIIDYGLSKRYRDPKTHKHIPFREGKQLTGTARYASINTHLGIEQSRRDDLEGIAYVLIYLLKGSLPWQGLKAANRKERYEKISEKKISTPVDVLCNGIPPEFATFLLQVRRLDFTDKPDYALYKQMFRDLLLREGYTFDYQYDWIGKNIQNSLVRNQGTNQVSQKYNHSYSLNHTPSANQKNSQNHQNQPSNAFAFPKNRPIREKAHAPYTRQPSPGRNMRSNIQSNLISKKISQPTIHLVQPKVRNYSKNEPRAQRPVVKRVSKRNPPPWL